jgi:hypothetical protein
MLVGMGLAENPNKANFREDQIEIFFKIRWFYID